MKRLYFIYAIYILELCVFLLNIMRGSKKKIQGGGGGLRHILGNFMMYI